MHSLLSSFRLLMACTLALLLIGGAAVTSAAAPLHPIEPLASTAQDDEDDDDAEGDSDTDADDGMAGGTGAGALDEPADRPAHIHAGTCAELDPNPAFPLENVMPFSGQDDEVEHSMTTVEASLDDILAEPHAINVHLSPEQADVYVACGEITGTVADGELVIALHQQNGSGLAGIAMLTEDDDSTEVHVYLAPIDPESAGEATAAGDDGAGAADTEETTTEPVEDDAADDTESAPAGDDAGGDDATAATPESASGGEDGGEGEDEED